MKRVWAAVAMNIVAVTLVAVGADPATAAGYGDGKPASKATQKAACSGTTGATKKACVKLAKLPDWWLNVGGVNYHKPNGAAVVKHIKGVEPKQYWLADFNRNIKLYKDNHAHISG